MDKLWWVLSRLTKPIFNKKSISKWEVDKALSCLIVMHDMYVYVGMHGVICMCMLEGYVWYARYVYV
jgi:hypothetical protein